METGTVAMYLFLCPAGLFGEDPANRRERLRGLLSAQLERGELLEAVEEAAIAATAVSHHSNSLLYHTVCCRLMRGCGFMRVQSSC